MSGNGDFRLPVVLRQLNEVIEPFISQIKAAATAFVESLEVGLSNVRAVGEAAGTLATRYRWCISTSWPPELMFDIAQLAENHRPFHDFEQLMMRFYRNNSWEETEKIVLATCSYGSIASHRRRVLLDTIALLRAGDRDGFNSASFAIPTLFAMLEGILRDFATSDLGLVDGPGKSITAKDMMAPLEAVAAPIEKPACELISRLLFASYRDKLPPLGRRFNRHYYSHGRAKASARLSRVVRLLLMIDLVAYLIDRKRGSQEPIVRVRTAWSTLLSGFSLKAGPSLWPEP